MLAKTTVLLVVLVVLVVLSLLSATAGLTLTKGPNLTWMQAYSLGVCSSQLHDEANGSAKVATALPPGELQN